MNRDDVVSVFEQARQEHQQQRQARLEENLNKAVSDGVITEVQKQALIQKHEEVKTQRGQAREEMHTWMEQNGVDPLKLREYGLGMGGFGKARGFWS